MNKIFRYILGFAMIASLGSCEKNFLDVNTDPNNPPAEVGTPALIFPSAVASTAVRVGGEYAILGGMWSQYWTQSNAANQYKFIDAYNVTSDKFRGSFNEMFSGALNDYNFVITKSQEDEDWIFFLMGTVMKAYSYEVMVDLYDKVPYTEAFQGDANLTPKYDDGAFIYRELIKEIDNALAKDFSAITNTVPDKADFIFNGDATKWKQFANTLKLKLYLRMVNAFPAEAKAGVESVFANGIGFLTEDAAMTQFEDAPDKSNPFYEYNYRQLNVATNLKASKTLMSWLEANGDPRLDVLFTPGTGGQASLDQGNFNVSSTVVVPTSISVAKQSAVEPVRFISAAESYFMQAEAVARYGVAGDAKALYDLGVQAAFNEFAFDPELYKDELPNLDPTALLASGGAYEYPNGTFEENLEAIITQKWVSCVGSHALEGFMEKNRTGYPKTSTVYSDEISYVPGRFVYSKEGITSGLFPKRLIFSGDEYSRNPNTPTEVPVTENVWWAK
ncbi:SusD/RagB family nutrient-binding outer membrane lipoprotein [Ancylomarina longa]|uniref:SusD/RagB family nutrient-binding outer membrane lipoprotein n=1 Tax=Ancylomarina longa TaxID=2487017 RepID=A0A434AEU1_9BACT|nr:SusD/RagB family nutrient-binding outer membrane lipoprotein [Ancylomarina longa]RUT72910.1 SusD/RagB family nutrient-binding outer membrane lipoprotein [Ancylomarina longa]